MFDPSIKHVETEKDNMCGFDVFSVKQHFPELGALALSMERPTTITCCRRS